MLSGRPSLRVLVTVAAVASLALTAAACGAGDPNPWYPNPEALGPPSPACLHAREQRARVPGLLDEGKLARAIKLMQRFEGACPALAPTSWAAHVAALLDVGRVAEAQSLAARIERSDRTSPEDRRVAKEALSAALAREHAIAAEEPAALPAGEPLRWTPSDDTRFDAEWATHARARALFLGGLDAEKTADHATAKRRFQGAWLASHPNPRALVEAGMAAAAMGERAEAQRLWDRAAFDGSEPLRPELPNGAAAGLFDSRLVWSPGGRWLALASEGQIAVYDGSLRLRRRIDVGERATAVAFSPAEDELFAGLEGGGIRRYHLALATARRDLSAHGGPVLSIAGAPDGKRIATASNDGTLRIWQGAEREPQILAIPREPVSELAWSEDGGTLAGVMGEGRVVVWDAGTGTAIGTLTPRGGVVRAVVFGPDPKALTVVMATERLRYDLGHLKAAPRSVDKGLVDLASGRHGEIALAMEAMVVVKDAASSEAISSFPVAPSNSVLALALSPDGKALAVASRGRALRLFPVGGAGEPRALTASPPLEALAISPDGKRFAVGAEDGGVQLWQTDPAGLSVLERSPATGAHARAVAFSPDGQLLAFGSDTGAVEIWDAIALRPLGAHRAEAAVLSLGFSPDSGRLAIGADAPAIHIVNARSAAPLGEVRLNAGGVRAVAFSLDGQSLLSASQEGVTHWDPSARKGSRYGAYGQATTDLAWSPDGAGFAVGAGDASLSIGALDSASPAHVVPIPARVVALAFSSKGALATAEGDRSVVYRTAAGKPIQRFNEPDAAARDVAFTPGGLIAAVFADGSIRIFRPPAPKAVAVLRAGPGQGSTRGTEAGLVSEPGGHVDFLGDGASLRAAASCRIGMSEYPFEVCAEQFLVPGLLGMALTGQDPAEADP